MRGVSLAALPLAAALSASSAPHSGPAADDATPVLRIAQAAAKKLPETRDARGKEVSVRVLLLPNQPGKDSEEYVEVGGERYIHFKSPQLKSPARPLADMRLRYPTGEFEQKNGAVILQLLIDEKGRLLGRDIVCAAPPFVKSALESVQGLKFRPAEAKEGPVKSYMLVEFGYGKGYPCGRIPN